MILGLAELLLAANLTIGAPAAPTPVALPSASAVIDSSAIRPLAGTLARAMLDPGQCSSVLDPGQCDSIPDPGQCRSIG